MGKTVTICFTNNKGGSGKSTTCSNLGAAMARVGCAMAGGKMSDFMPWPKEEEQEATLEGVMAVLNAARKG